jgi:hypothetical protein
MATRARGQKFAKESGEDRLIARHFKPIAWHPGALGLTDDAAMLTPPPGHTLVVTADANVGGVHFFPDDPPDAIARKALRVNLSDLAAKGAKAAGFVLTLALPKGVGDDWLKAFARGLGADAKTYDCPLLGGDTVYTPGPVAISITAFGTLPKATMGQAIGRAGGRPRHCHRHHRRRGAGIEAAQGARRRQALEARRGDAAPSCGALSRPRAAQRSGRSPAPERLRRHGRVRRSCWRSRQAVPCLRRRRRDRGCVRAAVQGRAGGRWQRNRKRSRPCSRAATISR